MKKLFISILAGLLLFPGCFEDFDDIPVSNLEINLEIQNFIYRGLNYFYLYKADTPELANDAFLSNEDRNSFLEGYESPEALFEYLKSDQDRFSFLTDDYVSLENRLSGVTLNNGMEFGLVFFTLMEAAKCLGMCGMYYPILAPQTMLCNEDIFSIP